MKRGYFAIGICGPKFPTNVGTLWRTADLLGAAFIFTVGARYDHQRSDTRKVWRHTPLWHFANLDDLLKHLPDGCRLVGVEIDPRARKVESFTHPTRCVYLLGAEDSGLNEAARSTCEHLVLLPGKHSMNVAAAGAIVLYDRHAKTVAA